MKFSLCGKFPSFSYLYWDVGFAGKVMCVSVCLFCECTHMYMGQSSCVFVDLSELKITVSTLHCVDISIFLWVAVCRVHILYKNISQDIPVACSSRNRKKPYGAPF